MGRLPAFDYSAPFFYLVTLKKARGARAFSRIVANREPPRDRQGRPVYLVATPATRALAEVVRGFHLRQAGVAPITCFIVMPDHLHLLVRLTGTCPGTSLIMVVQRLRAELAAAVGRPGEGTEAVFEPAWHDWIVKRRTQLPRFTRYIRRNPHAAWMRAVHPEYFTTMRGLNLAGRTWSACGNAELLEEPILVAVKGHRATRPDSAGWQGAVALSGRLGPGAAGVGTFMSPLEKACGNAIARAGGGLVVLRPEGFPPRWHPTEKIAPMVAEGRVLFLSPYEPLGRRLTHAELGVRCREMGDLMAKHLPLIEG